MPKVSVTMTIYNGERHLRETVASILGQTFPDFELVVINDGSTDRTAEILDSYGDPRMVVVHQENMGIPKSRNRAVSISRGEYIAIHDADDISLPWRLEKEVSFLDEHPDYGLVGSSYYHIDERSRRKALVRVLTDDADLRVFLRRRNWFGHGSVMMRKSAFIEVGGYDERFRYSLDYDLYLRMLEKFKVANLKEPLYCYRLSAKSVSQSKRAEQRYYTELAKIEAKKRLGPRIAADYRQNDLAERLRGWLNSEGLTEMQRITEIYGQSKPWAYAAFFFRLVEAKIGSFLVTHGFKGIVRMYRKLFYPHTTESL